MNGKALLALGLLVALGLLGLVLLGGSGNEEGLGGVTASSTRPAPIDPDRPPLAPTPGQPAAHPGSPRAAAGQGTSSPAGPAGTVRKGAPLRGVIRDAGGRPLAGIDIVISVVGPAGTLAVAARTGPDGAFEVAAPADGVATVRIQTPGLPAHEQPIDADGAVTVDLPPSAPVTGRVEDATGRPVPGAFVRAEFDGPSAAPVITQSDAGGRFTLQGLQAQRTYRLRATHPQHAQGPELEVVPPASDVVLVLSAGATLAVEVVGPDGEPVAAAPATAPNPHAPWTTLRSYAVLSGGGTAQTLSNWVDADPGHIRLEGLAAGTYRVEAAIRGVGRGRTGEIVVPPGGHAEAWLQLQAGGWVTVQVVPSDGSSALGATAQPVEGHGTPWAYLCGGSAGAEGTIRTGPFPAGPVTLRVQLGAATTEVGVNVVAGGETRVEARMALGD